MIDYEKLFGHSDVDSTQICKKVALEQQKKGEKDSNILLETLGFLIGQMDTDKIQQYNNMIREGIKGLAENKRWSNLHKVAKYAMEECEKTAMKSNVMETHSYIFKIKNEVLNTPGNSFKDIFKEEFLNKFEKKGDKK